jgi:peptide deformylase
MRLNVVKYGDPVLRKKGSRIEPVTPETRQLIADMLDTMEANHGVGLAAQQIGRALQLTVIDVTEVKDRPSWAEVSGKRVDIATFMPLVLINPQVTPVGDPETGPEGCLSFPELYADITRPGVVDVKAMDGDGQSLEFRCGGLLARAVQHEVDHLNGVLFIDRMSSKDKLAMQDELDALQAETRAVLARR